MGVESVCVGCRGGRMFYLIPYAGLKIYFKDPAQWGGGYIGVQGEYGYTGCVHTEHPAQECRGTVGW